MANASIQYGLRAAVVTTIQALITATTITGIVSASVKNRPIPSALKFKGSPGAGELAFPAIIVSNGDREGIESATNARDDVSYPILVAIFDDRTQDVDQSDDAFLAWRQTIIDTFRLGGYTITDPATEFHDVQVEPGPMLDWRRFQADGLYVGSFVLRFTTRK